jgi:hypothetical protein
VSDVRGAGPYWYIGRVCGRRVGRDRQRRVDGAVLGVGGVCSAWAGGGAAAVACMRCSVRVEGEAKTNAR